MKLEQIETMDTRVHSPKEKNAYTNVIGHISLWSSTHERAELYGDSMALFIDNPERRKMGGKVCAAAPDCRICIYSNQCTVPS